VAAALPQNGQLLVNFTALHPGERPKHKYRHPAGGPEYAYSDLGISLRRAAIDMDVAIEFDDPVIVGQQELEQWSAPSVGDFPPMRGGRFCFTTHRPEARGVRYA
jgi:hypothetical protein